MENADQGMDTESEDQDQNIKSPNASNISKSE